MRFVKHLGQMRPYETRGTPCMPRRNRPPDATATSGRGENNARSTRLGPRWQMAAIGEAWVHGESRGGMARITESTGAQTLDLRRGMERAMAESAGSHLRRRLQFDLMRPSLGDPPWSNRLGDLPTATICAAGLSRCACLGGNQLSSSRRCHTAAVAELMRRGSLGAAPPMLVGTSPALAIRM